jgi:hypothetical protein
VAALGAALVVAATAGPAAAGDPGVVRPVRIHLRTETPIVEGGSTTEFRFDLPDQAVCPGDSANDDYRVNSYMVPVDVDPASVEFSGNGPEPQHYGDDGEFRMPLFDLETSGVVRHMTANNDRPGQPGRLMEIPWVDFAVYEPGLIPPGTYNVGLACTLAGEVTNAWNATIQVTLDPKDEPAALHWAAVGGPEPVDGDGGAVGPVAAVGALLAAGGGVRSWRRRTTRTPTPVQEPRP